MATQEENKAEQQSARETPRQKIAKEIKQYVKIAQVDAKEDPLKWWADQATNFPFLSQVARRILAVPASSAPTERVFSKLARVNSKKRSSMKPSLSNALVI